MTPPIAELLEDLKARDIRLEAVDGCLRINAPKGALTEDLRQELKSRKPELLQALHCEWAEDARRLIAHLSDAETRVTLLDYFEETAAFIEFEQNRPSVEAEQQAFGLLLFQILRLGINVAPAPADSTTSKESDP